MNQRAVPVSYLHRCAIGSVSIAFAVHASVAQATICDDICPDPGPCTIGSLKVIEADSEIDCTGRGTITIGNSGVLKIVDSDFTLFADGLTVNGPGGLIYAVAGAEESIGGFALRLTGDLVVAGKLRANSIEGGGWIHIETDGDVSIFENGTDGIEADGTGTAGANGGQISIEAGGSILVNDPVHAEGAASGDTVGGSIRLHAGGNITTGVDGHISALGKHREGGRVELTSDTGNIVLAEHIVVDGVGETGNGGYVEVRAGNAVQVTADQSALGGVNQGGGRARGGSFEIRAGCGGVSIASDVLFHGGDQGSSFDGGSLVVESRGPVTIAGGVVLDGRGLAPTSSGGEIRLESEGNVEVATGATIDVRGGNTLPARGGNLAIQGCSVAVAAGSVLDVSGATGGQIVLNASGEPVSLGPEPLVVSQSASLRASGGAVEENGRIELAPLMYHAGKCGNNESVPCHMDVDCSSGCLTSDCLAANPDTGGQITQFSVAPVSLEATHLAACSNACPAQ